MTTVIDETKSLETSIFTTSGNVVFTTREISNVSDASSDIPMMWDVRRMERSNYGKSTIVSVFDVAAYIMQRLKRCTTMKLQKLLYYCQAWHLVWNDTPLFKEKIEAWANGPVVRQLYQFHKGLFIITLDDMTLGNPNKLSENQKADIDSVLDAYGDKSSQWLVEQTHMESPWRNARRGIPPSERGDVEITHQDMAEYYTSVATEQTLASDVVPSKPSTEAVSYGTANKVGRSQKKNRRRHSKEGYMTEQQWQDYFDARGDDEPSPSDNLIPGTEEEFKQIHSGRTIKDV